jgi:hypothetical protein
LLGPRYTNRVVNHSPLVLALTCLAASAQAPAPTAKAGGVELTLSAPADFVEVGDKLRTTFFELLAPSTNRLLTAYLPTKVLTEIEKGTPPVSFEVYAMVEVLRQAEYADCTPEAFAQVTGEFANASKIVDDPKLGAITEEVSLRLKNLGAKPVEAGRAEMLGRLFQKKDAAAMAMLIGLKQAEQSTTMICGMGALRLKQRLIFAYLFRRYESSETVDWIRKNLESWADAMLAKNK